MKNLVALSCAGAVAGMFFGFWLDRDNRTAAHAAAQQASIARIIAASCESVRYWDAAIPKEVEFKKGRVSASQIASSQREAADTLARQRDKYNWYAPC